MIYDISLSLSIYIYMYVYIYIYTHLLGQLWNGTTYIRAGSSARLCFALARVKEAINYNHNKNNIHDQNNEIHIYIYM